MCKPNRSACKTQPIYLSSSILTELLFTLFYLFNNSLQNDATKAIDAIYQKANNDLLVDVLLVCAIFILAFHYMENPFDDLNLF